MKVQYDYIFLILIIVCTVCRKLILHMYIPYDMKGLSTHVFSDSYVVQENNKIIYGDNFIYIHIHVGM